MRSLPIILKGSSLTRRTSAALFADSVAGSARKLRDVRMARQDKLTQRFPLRSTQSFFIHDKVLNRKAARRNRRGSPGDEHEGEPSPGTRLPHRRRGD